MKRNKMAAPRRAATTKEARQRLRDALRAAELDRESLDLIERLVSKLAGRSPIRRR